MWVRTHHGQRKMICDQRILWFSKDLEIRWSKVSVIKAHWNGGEREGKLRLLFCE